jgi:hypothetical protein
MTTTPHIPDYHLFLYEQARNGRIKAYFARNERMEAKIKFCTEGKPTYVSHPYSEALVDCAEYVVGGFRKLYHAGCGYHA